MALDKAERLRALGADRVLDRRTPNLAEALGPLDVALDVVGQGLFEPLIDALKPGGRYSSSGAIAGAQVDFDLRQLIYKDLQLTGATIVPPGTFTRLVTLIETRAVVPILAQSFFSAELCFGRSARCSAGVFSQEAHWQSCCDVPLKLRLVTNLSGQRAGLLKPSMQQAGPGLRQRRP